MAHAPDVNAKYANEAVIDTRAHVQPRLAPDEAQIAISRPGALNDVYGQMSRTMDLYCSLAAFGLLNAASTTLSMTPYLIAVQRRGRRSITSSVTPAARAPSSHANGFSRKRKLVGKPDFRENENVDVGCITVNPVLDGLDHQYCRL